MALRFLYLLVQAFIWGAICFVLLPEPIGLGEFQPPIFPDSRDALPFLLYGILLNAVMFYSYAHLALPTFLRNNSLLYFLLINGSFILGFVLLESAFDSLFMHQVYGAGRGQGAAPWSYGDWLSTNGIITASFMLGANLYGFTYAWFMGQEKRKSLEQATLQAELLALKHQINPHFLFNILNGLYGLAFRNDDEPTAEGIAKLSLMMRYMLYESNSNLVPLQKELEYIQHYIDLQKLRIQSPEKKIAPMVLIPFIENAFKHGISTVHSSFIEISLNLHADSLVFGVINPIHREGKGGQDTPGGIGLQNVRRRLELLYPDRHQLVITAEDARYHIQLTLSL
jgi:hypothetical protein